MEIIGYSLVRYREDMVRNKNKSKTIDDQLKEFENRLRRQMLRDSSNDKTGCGNCLESSSMPQIHVSLGALQASRPAAQEYETVSGD